LIPALRPLVDNRRFQNIILVLIVLNAITLGLETWPLAMQVAGGWIVAFDRIALAIFTIEVALRILAHGLRFFRDPWSLFDLVVVAIALVPTGEGFAVLRALRVLRVLRLISAVPSMRSVVQGLIVALPGISSVMALMALVFYVASVMATKLFSAAFPDWFGSVGASLYTLFQIMTLESWSMGIVRPVMEQFPHAWMFFVPFILIATFMILNLFIGVVVGAMQSAANADRAAEEQVAHDERGEILLELRALRQEVAALRTDRPPSVGQAIPLDSPLT
jgi:voltage-gated sodium channel